MTLSVNEVTKVITVPQSDLLLQSGSVYTYDTETFRTELRQWEASFPGGPRSTTHKRNPPVTVGGITLAQTIEVINGYTVTFQDGQYRVILQGSNNNILDVANVNQVSIAPTNSAGLTYSKQVEDQSFTDSRVWVNTISGRPGTDFPRGTPGDPVDNLTDTQSIIANRTLPQRIFLRGPLVVASGQSISNYDIKGSGAELASINLATTSTSNDLVVEGLEITGDLSGSITARNSTSLVDIDDFNGTMANCGVGGTITLADNADVLMDSCYSQEPFTGTPIFVMGANSKLQLRNWSGGVEVRSLTAGCEVSVDLDPGRLRLNHVSNTGGNIVLRGTGDLQTTTAILAAVTLDDGGFGLSEVDRVMIEEIYKVLELDQNDGITHTKTAGGGTIVSESGDINIVLTDGTDTRFAKRQP